MSSFIILYTLRNYYDHRVPTDPNDPNNKINWWWVLLIVAIFGAMIGGLLWLLPPE